MNSRSTILFQQRVLMSVQEPPDASSEVSGRWYGLCEKNSIHSINDFLETVESDGLLTEYFSDFDWKNARMGTLENAVWTHIAYRKYDKISTTRRIIRLPKGDGYITDGKRWLRTYCCNDYVLANSGEAAASPDRLVADDVEPPERLIAAVETTSTDPDTVLDQLVKKVGPLDDVYSLVDGPDRLKKVPRTIVTSVPEPSPFLLMGAGIALLALMTWRQNGLNEKR